MIAEYAAFLAGKAPVPQSFGFEPEPMPDWMFDYQQAATRFCIERGRAALSRVTVWKDPVVEMTRTKALGLLYKQLQKDSTRSRQGMADYVLVFRASGENVEPVGQDKRHFPVEQWQQWASPVWMDIRQTNTLNVQQARAAADERHVCPLQLDLIERCVTMWSNPGDIVVSPFMGIGSEGVVSLRLKRKFIGVELKDTYFATAARNLATAEATSDTLFDLFQTIDAVE